MFTATKTAIPHEIFAAHTRYTYDWKQTFMRVSYHTTKSIETCSFLSKLKNVPKGQFFILSGKK
jgi:hypothetical protein